MRNLVNRMGMAAAIGALALAGCGGDDGFKQPEPPDTGDYYHYVQTSLLVPTTPAEQQRYGLDLDGDPQGRPDNRLGGVFSVLSGFMDMQSQIDEAIEGGSLILLHSIRADDIVSDSSVSWQVYIGESESDPDYTGGGQFTIDPAGPKDALVVGRLIGGQFTGGPGTVDVVIPLVEGADPLVVTLIGARIEADITADGCAFNSSAPPKLGGAITKNDLDTKIMPVVFDMVKTTLDRDCPYGGDGKRVCETGSTGKQIMDIFDPENTGDVTLEMIKENDLIVELLKPDVDLLDCGGSEAQDCNPKTSFNPRKDGVPDSLSLGIAFDCINAKFTASGEASAQVN
jgi:hypothetical protein